MLTRLASSDPSKSGQRDFLTRLLLLFKSVFLPAGFPKSVSEDYVAYQVRKEVVMGRYIFTGVEDTGL